MWLRAFCKTRLHDVNSCSDKVVSLLSLRLLFSLEKFQLAGHVMPWLVSPQVQMDVWEGTDAKHANSCNAQDKVFQTHAVASLHIALCVAAVATDITFL